MVDKYNLSKQELRKMRRKKETIQAFAVFGVVVLIALVVLGGAGVGVYSLLHKQPQSDSELVQGTVGEAENETASAPVVEEPKETYPIVSQNSTPEEEGPIDRELTDEEKAEILDETIAVYINDMTIEQKVAGLFFITPEELTGKTGITIGDSTLNTALSEYPVGGLLLTRDNMESTEQLKELIFNLKSVTGNELFIGVAETGGADSPFIVSGLKEAVITGQREIGESGENSAAYTYGIAVGNLMNEYGFNTVIGPLADIALQENGYTSGESFGNDPTQVKDMVRNAVRGVEDQNINTCVKFFPGYGDITGNPASSRPTSSRTKEDIVEKDYPIYEDAIDGGADFIMVSQIAYSSITRDVPACLSSAVVTDMLRGELEYDGIVITDYLDTRSLIMHYKHADMAVMAIQAGGDMLFCSGDFKKAYNGILSAVERGDITEERIDESLYRIYRVKYRNLVDYEGVAIQKGWLPEK